MLGQWAQKYNTTNIVITTTYYFYRLKFCQPSKKKEKEREENEKVDKKNHETNLPREEKDSDVESLDR